MEIQSIIIMVGHGGMQADMVLEKELRVLFFDLQENRTLTVTLGRA